MNIDCMFNRWAWHRTIRDASVDKTMYKCRYGKWTEDLTRAVWHPYFYDGELEKLPWNLNFKTNIPEKNRLGFTLHTEGKYVHYFIVAGKRYDDINEAKNAMYDEMFVKPCVIPLLDGIINRQESEERKAKRLKRMYPRWRGNEYTET